jgi:hypothetical protein
MNADEREWVGFYSRPFALIRGPIFRFRIQQILWTSAFEGRQRISAAISDIFAAYRSKRWL